MWFTPEDRKGQLFCKEVSHPPQHPTRPLCPGRWRNSGIPLITARSHCPFGGIGISKMKWLLRSISLTSLVRGSSLDLGGGDRKVEVEIGKWFRSFSHTPFPAGYQASHSTPIQWHQGFERKAHRRRHGVSSVTFFNWLSDHSITGSDQIAEVGSHVGTGPELVILCGSSWRRTGGLRTWPALC